jgi:NAD-dependent dihydropyrimidine dehydrogenase PreA subunit
MPYVVSDECILCGACVSGCANGAIREGDTKSVIDPSLCVECGTCADNCPSGAIAFVEEKDEHTTPTPLLASGETGGLDMGDRVEKGQVGEQRRMQDPQAGGG